MTPADLVIRSARVVTPEGIRPAAIEVRKGRIAALHARDARIDALAAVDAGDAAVLPGIVDTHVHVNDPGRASWEGFETATKAAAAGGVTTVVDMPLNCIPATTTAEALALKTRAARGKAFVDLAFWGGVVPGNLAEIGPLLDGGAPGCKAFLVDSGVPEFPPVEEADLRPAMAALAERGAVLLAHAELPGPIAAACCGGAGIPSTSRRYRDFLASRPKAAENEAVDLLVRLARETGCRVHVVHLSSAEALGPLRSARAAGIPVTVETCPHYLGLTAEEIPDGGTEFKCCPPIREEANRDALWAGLREGVIDMVVSDHSPSPPEMKRLDTGDFLAAWGGISSLQLSLSAVWTAARKLGFGLADVARWMAAAPARLAGLSGRKGAIAAGLDADLVVFEPESGFDVAPGMIRHRHKLTPWLGLRLGGVVRTTYLRGEVVYDRGALPARPRGIVLASGPAHPG